MSEPKYTRAEVEEYEKSKHWYDLLASAKDNYSYIYIAFAFPEAFTEKERSEIPSMRRSLRNRIITELMAKANDSDELLRLLKMKQTD